MVMRGIGRESEYPESYPVSAEPLYPVNYESKSGVSYNARLFWVVIDCALILRRLNLSETRVIEYPPASGRDALTSHPKSRVRSSPLARRATVLPRMTIQTIPSTLSYLINATPQLSFPIVRSVNFWTQKKGRSKQPIFRSPLHEAGWAHYEGYIRSYRRRTLNSVPFIRVCVEKTKAKQFASGFRGRSGGWVGWRFWSAIIQLRYVQNETRTRAS